MFLSFFSSFLLDLLCGFIGIFKHSFFLFYICFNIVYICSSASVYLWVFVCLRLWLYLNPQMVFKCLEALSIVMFCFIFVYHAHYYNFVNHNILLVFAVDPTCGWWQGPNFASTDTKHKGAKIYSISIISHWISDIHTLTYLYVKLQASVVHNDGTGIVVVCH